MDFEKSALWREVEDISAQAQPVHAYWSADIHTPSLTVPAMKVLSVDEIEDFTENFSDIVVLRVAVPAGQFATKVYPNKSQLEITLYRNAIGEVSSGENIDDPRQSERYVATLFDRGSPIMDARGQQIPTEDSLDLTKIEIVDFQLFSKAVEQVRMHSVGGRFRRHTPKEILEGLFASESRKLSVDGQQIPDVVDVTDPSNTAVREHYDLPHGIKLIDVPSFIQRECGGIYSTGLAYYLKKEAWYFWGAFDTTRFNKADYTLTMIVVPSHKLPGSERTYRLDGKNLVVLVTGDVKFLDDSEQQQLNHGNGVRSGDASTVMTDWVTVENNKATASRGASNNEFVGQPRPNGNNNIQISPRAMSANSFELSSDIARRQGSHFDLLWENSNPRLLRPGMPVRVLYLDNDEIKILDGAPIRYASYVETVGPGLLSTRHRQNTRITLFVNNKLE